MSFAILTTFLNHRENSQIYANRAKEASWTTIQRGFRNFSSWKLSQPPSFFSRPPLLSSKPSLRIWLCHYAAFDPMPASIPTSSSTPFSLRARSASFNPSARCCCFPQLFKRFKHNTNMEKLSFVLIIIILLIFQSIGFFFLFRFFLFFLDLFSDKNEMEHRGRSQIDRRRILRANPLISFAINTEIFFFFFFSGSFYNS